ncbi:beta-ketoacyl synthase N-terminal-like domain-containing protein [Streptomyces sp. NPDC059788]|uniref:type I polyketide synthase n=1 Tax=Streptomyces sp. NPDC059788 TaxID=3346948 RepID=UPI00364A3612
MTETTETSTPPETRGTGMSGAPAQDADHVAIVGMAGRFPDAPDLDRFWSNLVRGHESIREVSAADYLAAGGDPAGLDDPYLVRKASVVDGIELFDADFFGYRPTEADLLDPQHRLFLECCHHALEHAGHDPDRFEGLTGVYAGAGQSKYFLSHVHPRLAGEALSVNWFSAGLSNDPGAFATRAAYELNLTGPAVSVQTACSTSLVAVHLACQDLINYRCDAALAGGASLNPLAKQGYRYVADGPFSPDGHCRAFDAAAAGMSPGDGVGAVVLKRLDDALADGDHIWAVIKGSAVNNDGNRKVGFTAPSTQGQTEAILAAQAAAGVDGDSIGYVEAHGTGTALGDPIEVAALTEAFRQSTGRRGFCALGSVKTNIGHLDAAAGIAGLIKAALALKHRTLPATLHFTDPNPAIDFSGSPFYVSAKTLDWPSGDGPRRAAVSSLGVGGTNAHLILEEAPATRPAPKDGPRTGRPVVLPLSAKTPQALRELSTRIAEHLAEHPELAIGDVAHSLARGRKEYAQRRAVVCRSGAEARELLTRPEPAVNGAERPQVTFLFPGGGAHHDGMGKELYDTQPVFRGEIDRAAAILLPVLGQDLRHVLYEDAAPERSCSFPALVATEYATARLLIDHGADPDALIGHSLGEYTAACLAGVLSLEDALPLVAERERLLELVGGSTLSVSLSEDAVRSRLTGGLSLATVNAPQMCTVSGPTEDIERLERELDAAAVEHRRVRVATAAHSHLLDPVLDDYAKALDRVTLHPPRIPFLSGVTGTWITDEQATSREYWVRQCRATVRFADGLQTLHDELSRHGRTVLVESGPGRMLSRFAELQLDTAAVTVAAMRHPKAEEPDTDVLVRALAALWTHGAPVRRPDEDGARHVPLPGYPFQRRRHWIDAPPTDASEQPVYVLPNGLREDNYPVTRAVAARTRGRLIITDPAAGDAAPAGDLATGLAEHLGEAERRLRDRTRVEHTPADRRSMTDRWCALYTCAYLRRHGIGAEPGFEIRRADVVTRLGTVPAYRKFVHALLDMLVDDGIVKPVPDPDPNPAPDADGDTLRFTGDTGGAEEIAELEQALLTRFPAAAEDLDLVKSCVAEYDAVLTGAKSGTEVLRPDGRNDRSASGAERLLSHGDVAVYRALVVEEVSRLVDEAAGRPLRILEVGGGQGYLTWPVAEALRGSGNVTYHFTDLGRSFVVAAQHEAAERGLDFMTFGVLDVDRGAGDQDGRDGRAYDIVLAFNVLHATPDLPRTVSNLHTMLAPGGLLFVLEAASTPRTAMMSVGLFEGWWYFDDDIRTFSPLIPPHRWQELLQSAGLRPVLTRPDRADEHTADHGLIIGARAPLSGAAAGMARVAELTALGATVRLTNEAELPALLSPARAATREEAPKDAAPAAEDGEDTPATASFNRRPDLATTYVAPRTELQGLVTRHWADVLGLDRVGIHDNFFDLGGDSLLVLQMAGRLRDESGVDLSVKKLFENLTPAEVAREIEALRRRSGGGAAHITPSKRRGDAS